jgi:hypothetical protein
MATTPISDVRQQDGSSDRRWVILLEDGRVSALGRARDPSDEEVALAEGALAKQGISGWLAIQSHSIHASSFPTFMAARPMGTPRTTFEEAVDLLRRNHNGQK